MKSTAEMKPDSPFTAALLLLLFGSFVWTGGVSETTQVASLEQIAFRVVPVSLAFGIGVSRHLVSRRIPSVVSVLFRYPTSLFAWAVGWSMVFNLVGPGKLFLLWKTFEYLTLLVVTSAFGALRPEQRRHVLRWVLLFCISVAIVGLAQLVVMPELTQSRSGFLIPQAEIKYPPLDPNQLGVFLCAVLFMWMASENSVRRWLSGYRKWGVLAVLALALLAQSRSSLLVLGVLAPVALLSRRELRRDSRRKLAAAGLGMFALVAIVLVSPSLRDFFVRGDTELFLSGSNRDSKWFDSISVLREDPWFGRGTGVSGRFDNAATVIRNKVLLGQAHSAPFEVLLSHGVVGGAPILILAGVGLKKAVGHLRHPNPSTPWAAGYVFLLITGVSNSFVYLFSPISLLFHLCLLEAVRRPIGHPPSAPIGDGGCVVSTN